ncbi:MAG TPA: DUF6385 domain-containing protein [Negativicutes bacterium]
MMQEKICGDHCADAETILERLSVSAPFTASETRNVSDFKRYTFFIKLITGNNISVAVQISFDGREWFTDSLTQTLNFPPLLATDRVVLSATHYSCFARIATAPKTGPGELLIVLQGEISRKK